MDEHANNQHLRGVVLRDLPEIGEIADTALRENVTAAWCLALSDSSFNSVAEIPPEAVPGRFRQVKGNQTDHIRGVTRLALALCDGMLTQFPELPLRRDIVIAGGLCHDIGKTWEFDPARQAAWAAAPGRSGVPSLRHTAYGVHICLTAGLPEEIAHIAAFHSGEGDLVLRSQENMLVHYADKTYWHTLAACGALEPDSLPAGFSGYVAARS